MSMQAINYALTLPIEESGPRLLLIIIAHHINYRSGEMFVGQEELAEEVKCHVRSVRRYLGYLEEAGFITRQEQRSTDGKRTTDRIELIGYLEWQEVIEKGGVIPDPKTRGKPVKKPEDNFAGCEQATGQNQGGQPDKNPRSTGQGVSGIKGTISNQENHSADGRASEGARPPAPRKHLPQFVLTPSDAQWSHWVAWLTDHDQRDVVVAAQEARQMVTAALWPRDGLPTPRVDGRALIEKRKLGDAA